MPLRLPFGGFGKGFNNNAYENDMALVWREQ